MKTSDPATTIRVLLKLYGRTFAEDLGIDARTNEPSGLFCLLISALLFSTRINHNVAAKSARILFERGWTTPERLAAATWEQRVQALDEGGYVRYDERTSTTLAVTAKMLMDLYHGDLRKLRAAAERDPARERTLLDQFKGVGDVAVNIFFREAQLAWPELFPFADDKALACAKKLGLPPDSCKLTALVRSRRDFVRLVSAMVRVQLEHRHDEIIPAAQDSVNRSHRLSHRKRLVAPGSTDVHDQH